MKARRLFVAVPLSSSVLAALEKLQETLRPSLPGVRWTRREGMHMTLRFLGETNEALMAGIAAALRGAAAKTATFDALCAGLGVFPDVQRARVLWAGVREGTSEMTRLASGVEDTLKPLGFESERRAFTPHITLGRIRFREDARALAAALDAHARDEYGVFRVESFSLFESVLRPEGSQYRVIETFALAAESRL